MKELLLGTLALVALNAGSAVLAADMPVYKAPVYQAPEPVRNWTGFYVGLNAGYAWTHASFGIVPTGSWSGFPAPAASVVQVTTNTLNSNRFAGGGQIGWNYQISSVVFGLEADLDYIGANGTVVGSTLVGGAIPLTSIVGFSQQARERWLGTVRGRLGVLPMPQALLYVTGGLAVADWDVNMHMTSGGADAVFANASIRTGWTVGGGLEVAFGKSWSGKLEYLHADFGSVTGTSVFPSPPNGANFTQTHNVRLTTDTVRVGINYHFNWAGPVVASY